MNPADETVVGAPAESAEVKGHDEDIEKAIPAKMDDDDSDDEDEADDKKQAKRRCGGRLSNRCFWVLISLAAIVALLVILIPTLIFTVGKDYAQSQLDGSEIIYNEVAMYDLQPTNLQSTSALTVLNSGNIKTKVKASTCDLSVNGTVFGTIANPEFTVGEGNSMNITLNSVITVLNDTIMNEQSAMLMSGQQVNWNMDGKVDITVYVLGIPISYSDLNMDKVITINGDTLTDIVISDFTVVGGNETTLSSTVKQTMTSNGSVSISDSGDFTFAVIYENVAIGSAFIRNFSLHDGQNVISEVMSYVTVDGSNDDAVTDFLTKFINEEDIPVQIKGPIEVSSGANYLLNTVFQDATVSKDTNSACGATFTNVLGSVGQGVAQSIFDASTITYNTMKMFAPTNVSIESQAGVTVANSGVRKSAISGPCNIVVGDSKMATMTLQELWVGDNITSIDTVANAPLTNINNTLFQEQSALLMSGTNIFWNTTGSIQVKSCVGGASMVYSVNMDKPIAMNGSALTNAVADNVTVAGGDATTLSSYLDQTLENTGNITLADMGNMTYSMLNADGEYLGTVLMTNFSVFPGANSYKNILSEIKLTNDNSDAVSGFLTSFINEETIHVKVNGPVSMTSGSEFLYNTVSLDVTMKPQTNSDCGSGAYFNVLSGAGIETAQDIFDASVLTYGDITMYNPAPSDISVNSTIYVTNSGVRKSTVAPSSFGVFDPNGNFMANMRMPSFQVGAQDLITLSQLETPMSNIVDSVMQPQIANLMKGNWAHWTTGGKVNVTTCACGAAMTYEVNMNKPIDFQGGYISDATAFDEVILGGEKEVLSLTCSQTLTNPSNISLTEMGTMYFELYTEGFKVGEVTMDDFQILKGFNSMTDVATKIIQSSAEANSVIRDFLSENMMGNSYTMTFSGPVSSSTGAKYMYNTVSIPVVIQGQEVSNLILQGAFPTGNQLTGPPTELVQNPLAIPVRQKNLLFEVFGDKSIGFKMGVKPLGIPCPSTSTYSNLTLPRAGKDMGIVINAKGKGTSEGATVPNPKNVTLDGTLDTTDTCDMSAIPALCTYLLDTESYSNSIVNTHTSGTFDLYFGCSSLDDFATDEEINKCFENAFHVEQAYFKQQNIVLQCYGDNSIGGLFYDQCIAEENGEECWKKSK
eukprot:Nk52_evm13s2356 gene=Nk52_evmTU13s2356